VVVGLAEGGLMGVVYALAGVPHAALMALLTGLVSVIPMGATLAALLAAGILAALGSPLAGAVVAVVGVVGIFIADHFVRPVMIGDATRLPFVWVLLGILGGVEVWGLIGLVLGPALIAALMLLWREFIGAQAGRSTLRRIEKRKREEAPSRSPDCLCRV
jgi:predicted PurR-regulated permease PerM